MSNNKKIVRKWRGTRQSYNVLAKANSLDYWTRYSVKEADGTWTEYYGSNRISCPSGQLLPVIDIVETLPSILNPGDRYLVGIDPEWYITIIDYNPEAANQLGVRTEAFVNNSGMSVRVKNKESMAYQLVDGKLTTYDNVDGGLF